MPPVSRKDALMPKRLSYEYDNDPGYILQPATFTSATTMKGLGVTVSSNASPTDHPDCPGLRYNCTAATAMWVAPSPWASA